MARKNTVLITGAAKRIGRDIALSFAQKGWNIAIHYNHSGEEAEALAKEIKTYSVTACTIQADLQNEKDTTGIVDAATHALGPLHCLINNASFFANDTVSTLTPASWNQHLEVNLHAPMLLSQAFARQLPEGSHGNIINILDYSVWNLPNEFLSYSISKSALWTATKMLAQQLAPAIRVNAIGPGHVLKNDKESQKHFDASVDTAPLDNAGSPEDIIQALHFLISCPSVTGQMIAIDGGKHLTGAKFY